MKTSPPEHGLIFPGRCISIGKLVDEAGNKKYVGKLGFVAGPIRPYETVGDTPEDPLWDVRLIGGGSDGFWTEELWHPKHAKKETPLNYLYETNCTQCSSASDIDTMAHHAVEIDYAEMLRHCAGLLEWSEAMCYDPCCEEGQALEDDNMVHYYRSEFQGRPCLFVEHSGIEHIWLENTDATEEDRSASIERARREADELAHPTVSTLGKALFGEGRARKLTKRRSR